MDYWYLWLIFVILCVVTVVAIKYATKALSLHNSERQAVINELDRLTKLKEKFKTLDEQKIDESDALELVQGVTAVMQAKIEKADNPTDLFEEFSLPQKNIYTINYFLEDIATSLSFFFKNNGKPLTAIISSALTEIGENRLSLLCEKEYAMYDDDNEDVSVSVEEMKKTDEEFRSVFNENDFLEKTRQYIKTNISCFR